MRYRTNAATSLPGGLRVRPDVHITGGSLHLGAVARGDGADRVLEVRLDSRDIAAVRAVDALDAASGTSLVPIGAKVTAERPLRWSEPFTAWLKGRRGPAMGAGLRIEEARITSQAAEFSATGTPAAMQMQWSVNLGELAGELAEVIDHPLAFFGGDFQGRCHSLAAIQAASIKCSARIGSVSSGGLLIHTSSGWRQQRVLRLQRVGLAWRAAS